MKKEYWYYLGGFVFFLLIIGVAFFVMKKNAVELDANGNPVSGETKGGGALDIITKAVNLYTKGNTFPLQLYSFGSNVKRLQNVLNLKGEKLTVDGKLGPGTEGALIRHTGKKTITETELIALEGSVSNSNTSGILPNGSTQQPSNPALSKVENILLQLLADLNKSYLLGRGEIEPYITIEKLSNDELKDLDSRFRKNTVGTYDSLYQAVDKALFKSSVDTDVNIKNRLKLLGLS